MRRKDREVRDYNEILDMMRRCDVCRVAFFDKKYPYIVPMNFGVILENEVFKLYFHGAKEGTKLELMKSNPNVAFELDCSHKLIIGERACDTTMEYESVCGTGVMRVLDQNEKKNGLTILMNQYLSGKEHEFSEKEMLNVVVLELTVDQISGKRLKK